MLLLVVGCSNMRNGPGKTVQSFDSALEHRNYDEALSYYSSVTRNNYGDAKIRAMLVDQREKLKDPQAFNVTILEEKVAGDTALVVIREGARASTDTVALIRENGQWKIVGG